MKRGLYIGRFQPFHSGHLRVIKNALKDVDELIIVVGSSDKSFSNDNPMTAGERVEIIKETLKDEKVKNNYYIIPIPDIDINATWVSHVEMNVPKFQVVYSGTDLTKTLFEQKGYRTIPLERWKEISATEVRKRIIEDSGWEELVPATTARLLKQMNITNRIQEVANHQN